MDFTEVRNDVWQHSRKMWQEGLCVASAGNVSRRVDGGLIAITPTSVAYDVLKEEDIVIVELESGKAVDGRLNPSYELPMHLVVYRSSHETGAIVHTHAPYVTTLSVIHEPLPPIIDEMMIYFGGTIEVTDYAFTGTDDVGHHVIRALGDRTGVILANHGNVCIGRDLKQALHVAITMESTARVYVQAMQTGKRIVPLTQPAIHAGRRMYEERRAQGSGPGAQENAAQRRP
ncbi:MAG TPA: class II aldolase/adducin family protein [Thermoanaerobaculia bacterium]